MDFMKKERLNQTLFLVLKSISRLLLAAPEEGHDLRSGAIRVGAECGVGCAFGNFIFRSP